MPLTPPIFLELHDNDGIPKLINLREVRTIAPFSDSDTDAEEAETGDVKSLIVYHDEEEFEAIEPYKLILGALKAAQLAIATS